MPHTHTQLVVIRSCMQINKGPSLARLITVTTTEVFVWRMAVTESFIKRIRMRIHAYRIYTHTHSLIPLSIMFAQGTPTGPPPTPHPPSLLLLLPPPSRVLTSFRFSISLFRSISLAFPSFSHGWTCCRSDMQQHVRVTAVRVHPVHPFFGLVRSVFISPSSSLHLTGHLLYRFGRCDGHACLRPTSRNHSISSDTSAPPTLRLCVARQIIRQLLCSWSIVSGFRIARVAF